MEQINFVPQKLQRNLRKNGVLQLVLHQCQCGKD